METSPDNWNSPGLGVGDKSRGKEDLLVGVERPGPFGLDVSWGGDTRHPHVSERTYTQGTLKNWVPNPVPKSRARCLFLCLRDS